MQDINMKTLLYVCVLSLVGFAIADTKVHSRDCMYIDGKCVSDCPKGTHAYTTSCGDMTPEPSCGEPNPVAVKGMICDYSACYCDPPTVRDPNTNECVLEESCTDN